MVQDLANFMVFKLKDTGDKERIDITEERFSKNNGSPILTDAEVVLIVKESIRRIYIWKGIASSVRRKFIASRVASNLQKELTQKGNFHRCKVVSIDQGDELQEFLDHFNLKSLEKEELLKRRKKIHQSQKEKYLKPTSRQLSPRPSRISPMNVPPITQKVTYPRNGKKIQEKGKQINDLKRINNKEILKSILEGDVSSDYKRKHIIIGTSDLYGIVEKKARVFNKDIKEEEWEPITKFPRKIIELKNYCFRLHIDTEINKVAAIEVLEELKVLEELEELKELKEPKVSEKKDIRPKYKFSYWTVSKLRKYCKENNIDIPTGSKKDDIVSLVEDYAESH